MQLKHFDKWRQIRDKDLQRDQQRVHMLQHHQQQVQMHPRFSTKMDGIHQQQYHTTAKAFVDPESSLSDDDLYDMFQDPGDDALPVKALLVMIDSMLSSRREQTITWLQGE